MTLVDKSPTNIKLQGTIMSKRFLSSKHASSGISPSSLTAKSLLMRIQELGPAITARALEIETSRRIRADIVEVLKRAGIFRMFVPQSYGGLELDLPAGFERSRLRRWRANGAHYGFAATVAKVTYNEQHTAL